MTSPRISTHCPSCGTEAHLPVEALLASIAVSADAADPMVAASVAWTCTSCQDLAIAAIGWPMLLTLATAGVDLLDDATDALQDLPTHPERAAAGPALSADDALTLHELLATDAWFDELLRTEQVRP